MSCAYGSTMAWSGPRLLQFHYDDYQYEVTYWSAKFHYYDESCTRVSISLWPRTQHEVSAKCVHCTSDPQAIARRLSEGGHIARRLDKGAMGEVKKKKLSMNVEGQGSARTVKAQEQKKPKGKRSPKESKGTKGSEAPLKSVEELGSLAKEHFDNAEMYEEEAQKVLHSTFQRMLGDALRSRIGNGTKEQVKKLLQEMDKNGDGVLQKIELRQMVRNSLKLKVDNATIDVFFDSIDEDRSGNIELGELVAACHQLMEATMEAKEECETLQEKADHVRQRGEKYQEAAEGMREIERAEELMNGVLSKALSGQPAEGVPLQMLIGAVVSQRSMTMEFLTNLLEGKGKAAGGGSVSRQAWLPRLGDLGVSAVPAEEADRVFDELLAKQLKVERKAQDTDRGGKVWKELDTKWLAKTFLEYASEFRETQKKSTERLSSLRAAARKVQRAISAAVDSSFVKHQQSFDQKKARAEEAAREKAEKAAAAKAAKAAAAEQKAREKAEFDAKVEARRLAKAKDEAALMA